MSHPPSLAQPRDRGFTLVEVVVAIVLVGVLSAVAVVGVGGLIGTGTDAACTTSRDAAGAAAQVHFAIAGTHPVTFDEMFASGSLTLAPDHIVDGTGTTLSGDGWQLQLSPGTPPTVACSTSTAPATSPAPTITTATTVPMFSGPTEPMRLCVESSTGSLLDGAQISIYAGAWYDVGTTTAVSCLDADVPETTSAVAVRHRGVYQQVDWSAGTASSGTTVFSFATRPHAVRLIDSTGQGLSGATAEFYASGWQPLGTTDTTGCVTTELLTGFITFSMRHLGVYQQETVDTAGPGSAGCGAVPVFATFQTQPRFVQARSTTGQPIAGVPVWFYALTWQTFGTTSADGCASAELLGASVSVGAVVESVYRQVDLDLTTTPITSCATAAVLGP